MKENNTNNENVIIEGGLAQEVKDNTRYIYMPRPKKPFFQRFTRFAISCMILMLMSTAMSVFIAIIDTPIEEYIASIAPSDTTFGDTIIEGLVSDEELAQEEAPVVEEEPSQDVMLDRPLTEEELEDWSASDQIPMAKTSTDNGPYGIKMYVESEVVNQLQSAFLNDVDMFGHLYDVRYNGTSLYNTFEAAGYIHEMMIEDISSPDIYRYGIIASNDTINLKLIFELHLNNGDLILADVIASNPDEVSGRPLNKEEFASLNIFK